MLVPVRNEERWLADAVAAMLAQDVDGEMELLFADGGSTDGSRRILADLAAGDGRIRIFDNPRRITPSGLNVCLGRARGEFVARMDAHAFYPPTYLRDGIERLGQGETTWVSGPVIPRPVGRVSRAVALALASPLGHGGAQKWAAAGGPDEFDLDTGVFGGVWRRETLMACGGWDEGWPQNQDAELAGRFLARGERLVCLRTMGAEYVPRDTLAGLWRQYYRYGFYRVATARRHPHSLRRSHLLAPALTVTLGVAVVGPRPVRWPARLGAGLYAAALVAETGRVARRARPPADALLLPAVLAAIHLGNGAGMLAGVRRFGLPGPAVARAVGVGRLPGPVAASWQNVDAPSLAAP